MLDAFGLAGARLAPLTGGQGGSWLAQPLTAGGRRGVAHVVKPVHDEVEAAGVTWLCDALAEVEHRGDRFRLARARSSRARTWVVDGWRASAWVAGSAGGRGRWLELLAAAAAFHDAIAHLPRPAFLDERTDRWARADRAAWGSAWGEGGGGADLAPQVQALADRLAARCRASGGEEDHGRPQLVHGDLSGNVLFAAGLAPAIIDVSPYWRPPAYAGAIVVADALLWSGEDAGLLAAAGPAGAVDLVARALLFRLLDHHEALREGGHPDGAVPGPAVSGPAVPGLGPYERAAAVLDAVAASTPR